jgi:hypothetical protein
MGRGRGVRPVLRLSRQGGARDQAKAGSMRKMTSAQLGTYPKLYT